MTKPLKVILESRCLEQQRCSPTNLGKNDEALKAYEKANEINSHISISWPIKGTNVGLIGKPMEKQSNKSI